MPIVKFPCQKSTSKQREYIETLFNEKGIISFVQRKAFINLRFKKFYLTDLTSEECSKLITELTAE